MPPVLYSADVVCPMTGPPLADGGVLVDGGVIVDVAPGAALRPRAGREHHISGVLLPGFVDAATSLEHADAGVLARPGPAHAWASALAGLTGAWTGEQWSRSARRGVLRALRAGTTTLCDIVTRGPAVPAASRAGLAGTSYVEVADVDGDGADDVLAQVEAALELPAGQRRVGVAPASPARLGTAVVHRLAALANRRNAPLHVACAASRGEVAALRSASGPLADAARAAGRAYEWLAGGAPTPIRYLDAVEALSERATVGCATEVDDGEARLLARRATGAVCSPRADAVLSRGVAPLERYAAAGVNLALGTATPAAVGDYDVLAEAAAWAAQARAQGLVLWPSPAGPVSVSEAAVRLATVDGARTAGWGGVAGLLEAGRRADLVGLEVDTSVDTVYADLLQRGAGRQVLTVAAGVRRARRVSAADPWPDVDDDSWRR